MVADNKDNQTGKSGSYRANAFFDTAIPPFFEPKILFMMLQIRPEGWDTFAWNHWHFTPVEVVHYTPVCSLNEKLCSATISGFMISKRVASLNVLGHSLRTAYSIFPTFGFLTDSRIRTLTSSRVESGDKFIVTP